MLRYTYVRSSPPRPVHFPQFTTRMEHLLACLWRPGSPINFTQHSEYQEFIRNGATSVVHIIHRARTVVCIRDWQTPRHLLEGHFPLRPRRDFPNSESYLVVWPLTACHLFVVTNNADIRNEVREPSLLPRVTIWNANPRRRCGQIPRRRAKRKAATVELYHKKRRSRLGSA